MLSAHDAQLRLRQIANPADAAVLQRFFKTGPGEYGEGDQFLGIRAPAMRKIVAEFANLQLAQIDELLQSPTHEDRLLALLVMVKQYAREDAKRREKIYRLFLGRKAFVNNWDLVDSSAAYIVGPHLAGKDLSPIYKLANSHSVWDRRIAVLATFHFIRCDRFDVTLELARMLCRDEHDLIHKAVGWMLREIGKRDLPTLLGFLDEFAGCLPRTTLRYAIERLPQKQRDNYMSMPRAKVGVAVRKKKMHRPAAK